MTLVNIPKFCLDLLVNSVGGGKFCCETGKQRSMESKAARIVLITVINLGLHKVNY